MAKTCCLHFCTARACVLAHPTSLQVITLTVHCLLRYTIQAVRDHRGTVWLIWRTKSPSYPYNDSSFVQSTAWTIYGIAKRPTDNVPYALSKLQQQRHWFIHFTSLLTCSTISPRETCKISTVSWVLLSGYTSSPQWNPHRPLLHAMQPPRTLGQKSFRTTYRNVY